MMFVDSRLLGVLIPAIGLLLDPTSPDPPTIHSLAVAQLLSLATASPVAFKEATAKLDATAKDILESSIRQAIGSNGASAGQSSSKPQISLRSF